MCSQSVCPDLCEDRGEVTIANCAWGSSGVADLGKCYCICEDNEGRETCFAHGQEGASYFPEWILTDSECDEDAWSEMCESACDAQCIWGFPLVEARCRHTGVTFTCECLCGVCQFTV
jgi:hypothetical protein